MNEEYRVAIRYTTVDIPGPPAGRPNRIVDDFATCQLHRNFSQSRDFVHLCTDFDSEDPKRVWILCDFNIREPRAEVQHIPLEFWKVSYSGTELAYVAPISLSTSI